MFYCKIGNLNYELIIEDASKPDTSLVHLENEIIEKDIFLASYSNDLTIKVSASLIDHIIGFPYKIQYQEIPKTTIFERVEQNGTITFDDIQPNSLAEYSMDGYGEVQLFDVSWDFNDNSGYLALENGNGRITIMSIPYMSNFKV